MESKIPEPETKTKETQAGPGTINAEIGGTMAPAPSPASPGEQPWQEWIDLILEFLTKVPEEVGTFFADYKQPLITVALVITAAITVYLTLSLLDAIANIPLLSSILELVGLGYTIWFVTRYLLKASTREELFSELDGLKQQILGERS